MSAESVGAAAAGNGRRPSFLFALAVFLAGCGGGGGGGGGGTGGAGTVETRTRYGFADACVALLANGKGKYVVFSDPGYSATATSTDTAEPFYMKAAGLGGYVLYQAADGEGKVLSSAAPASAVALSSAAEATAVWTLTGRGDTTAYPPVPQFDVPPTVAEITAYRSFVDPNLATAAFQLRAGGKALIVDSAGALTTADASGALAESFSFVALQANKCDVFPEAQSAVVSGEPFQGTTSDGRVLGMADVHVHISATTFLGHAEWGTPFHKLGISHAMADCTPYHGERGARDGVGAAYVGDTDGHDTTGWPSFPDWPSAGSLTHSAIYWKWLERAWLAGLRIAVNDLVENETLCELQRNNSDDPGLDCNEMKSAHRQIGTMYAMQDYIDAQYGGRGNGWLRIVLSPTEARTAVAAGKLAVVLGIEVSNFLNCKLKYNPARAQHPNDEDGSGPPENAYDCTEESVDDDMDALWDLGVRQIISVHEFDNAFGGNGIFNGDFLNLGNRENTGGNPGTDPTDPFSQNPPEETPTGEFWTTYNCPNEGDANFSGYLWEDEGGSVMNAPAPPACVYTGQDLRPGGTTLCYPFQKRQCNARWLTPIGLHMYTKLMQKGFIFDFDHITMDMKTQVMDLADALTASGPKYPFVSTHGTYGGTTLDQASRALVNGGYLYPALEDGRDFIAKMEETKAVYDTAFANVTPKPIFGFGFGTDTNGLSDQAKARSFTGPTDPRRVRYPFTLFDGGVWETMPDFEGKSGVTFDKPVSLDVDGTEAQSWHIDSDGSAHYGMLSDMVEEVRLEDPAKAAEHLQYLFNSAERYLQTWQATWDARDQIGTRTVNSTQKDAILNRPAPIVDITDPPF